MHNPGGFYQNSISRAVVLTNHGGGTIVSPGATPQLSNPDFVFSVDGAGTQPSEMDGNYIDYNVADGGEDNVIRARYAPDGIQADSSAWSEITFEFPTLQAVQVVLKFREYIPASYVSTNANNHKSISFASGPYGITASNISVNSECWPANGGGTPSMYSGGSSIGGVSPTNNGHLLTSGSPLLWEPNQGAWHEVVAVLELAQDSQSYGRFRMYKNGTKLIDSAQGNGMNPRYDEKPSYECIGYADNGNFINRFRLCGWANKAVEGVDAFSGTMHFLYDDIEITANETFKPIVEPV